MKSMSGISLEHRVLGTCESDQGPVARAETSKDSTGGWCGVLLSPCRPTSPVGQDQTPTGSLAATGGEGLFSWARVPQATVRRRAGCSRTFTTASRATQLRASFSSSVPAPELLAPHIPPTPVYPPWALPGTAGLDRPCVPRKRVSETERYSRFTRVNTQAFHGDKSTKRPRDCKSSPCQS